MIVVCEVFRRRLDHAVANAALVSSIAAAFPEEAVVFFAEREHLAYVKKLTTDYKANVSYREIELADTSPPKKRRLETAALAWYVARRTFVSFGPCWRVFAFARKHRARRLVVCSVWMSELVLIKLLLRLFRQVFCLIVLHELTQALRDADLKRLGTCGYYLFIGNTLRLRYVVLAPPIEARLWSARPQLSTYVSSIDHPYLFADDDGRTPFVDNAIHFGFYGHASLRKGADIFFRLANEVSVANTRYKPMFTLVGQVRDKELNALPHEYVWLPSPRTFLDRDTFETYAKRVDYVLLLHTAQQYAFNASGVILDAFSFLKPIIALKTPLTEYYFDRMGDIGYMCSDYDEVKRTIMELLETKPIDRYRSQKNNILTQRAQFSPAGVSSQVRALLEQNK